VGGGRGLKFGQSQILLEHGADPKLECYEGRSPLDLAEDNAKEYAEESWPHPVLNLIREAIEAKDKKMAE
jgi:hypothetical protein